MGKMSASLLQGRAVFSESFFLSQLNIIYSVMIVLLYLIPIAAIIGIIGLVAFLWSLKNKQFEDLEGASNRILFIDEKNKKIN